MANEKRLRRLAREYAGKAWELELREALRPVAEAVHAWERGEIDSFELEACIHRFHQGAAREVYNQYSLKPEPAVARAIAIGLLDRESVPNELLEDLARLIAFFDVTKEPSEEGGAQ